MNKKHRGYHDMQLLLFPVVLVLFGIFMAILMSLR